MVLGFTCSFFFFYLFSPPPNLPAGIKVWLVRNHLVFVDGLCAVGILFPLLCRWFHQGLSRFPPLFVARVWTYDEAKGEGGGGFFFFFSIFKIKRKIQRANEKMYPVKYLAASL
jgi:hypothetical protein